MADPNKAAGVFGGLLGNAALKIKKRKDRMDDAVDDMANGRAARDVPLYEDEIALKKKKSKK